MVDVHLDLRCYCGTMYWAAVYQDLPRYRKLHAHVEDVIVIGLSVKPRFLAPLCWLAPAARLGALPRQTVPLVCTEISSPLINSSSAVRCKIR